MRELLWIGDAVADTGFARNTHKILDVVGKYWDVAVLGLNYQGDPHPYPYKIYPAAPGNKRTMGDFFGLRRIKELLTKVGPDLVVIQNDPWNFPEYLTLLSNSSTVGVIPVDGLNCRGKPLNGLKHAFFWTKFGLEQARLGGYTGQASVVPLGVDLDIYKPMDRADARRGLPPRFRDVFIVGNVNRNQPRKRLDLTIEYFADWIHSRKIGDAFLFLHVSPTGEDAIDCVQLASYYGVENRLIISEPNMFLGITEQMLARLYGCFDVQITTTQGEGWGLTTMEGMACGIPQIVPRWAALEEWCGDAVVQVPCTTFAATTNGINVIGGVPDKTAFVEGLDLLYRSREVRERFVHRGLSVVQQPQYRWDAIGERFAEQLDLVMSNPRVELDHATAGR